MTRIKALLLGSPLLSFFVCTYAFSWLVWFPVLAQWFGLKDTGQAKLLLFLGGFGPSVSALLLTWAEHGSGGVRTLAGRLRHWRVGFSWYVVALYGFPTIGLSIVALFGVADLRDIVGAIPAFLVGFPVSAVTRFLVVGPLGEELGWRGYALPRMLASQSVIASSVAMGILWAFWHTPLMLVSEWRGSVTVGVFLFLYPITLVALSAVFAWAYLGTNRSLLVVMILHASYNATLYYLNDVFRLGRVNPWAAMGVTALLLWLIVLGLINVLGPDLRPRG